MREQLQPGETLDVLTCTLSIIQRKGGHRAASDDVLLAWSAARAYPGATRVLDLGTGKGTVALLLLRRLPDCRVIGVEALPLSHALAVRNAACNDLSHRYEPRFGDLRDGSVLLNEPPFDLVCGAPPFMQLGSGTLPRDPQRAAGRFELRGGIRDYAEAAVRHLAPDGRAVFLMDGQGRWRAEEAMSAAGLHLQQVLGICPRPDRPATYWILQGALEAPDPGRGVVVETLCMRPPQGEAWSAPYAAIRREMDLPPSAFHDRVGE